MVGEDFIFDLKFELDKEVLIRERLEDRERLVEGILVYKGL